MRQLLAWSILLVLTSGCASTYYEPPQHGPTAKINIPNEKPYSLFAIPSTSSTFLFGVGEKNDCAKMIKVESDDTDEDKIDYTIPANKIIHVRHFTMMGAIQCYSRGNFMSQEGAIYEVHQLREGHCNFNITEQVDDQKRTLELGESHSDFFDGGVLCHE